MPAPVRACDLTALTVAKQRDVTALRIRRGSLPAGVNTQEGRARRLRGGNRLPASEWGDGKTCGGVEDELLPS